MEFFYECVNIMFVTKKNNFFLPLVRIHPNDQNHLDESLAFIKLTNEFALSRLFDCMY